MNDAIDQDDLIRRFDQARAALLAVVDALPDADFARTVGADDWTVHDLLTHIEGWDVFALGAVGELIAGGQPVFPPSIDAYNAAFIAARRQRSPAETRTALLTARQELRAVLESAPLHLWVFAADANVLSLPRLVRIWTHHDEEHTAEVHPGPHVPAAAPTIG